MPAPIRNCVVNCILIDILCVTTNAIAVTRMPNSKPAPIARIIDGCQEDCEVKLLSRAPSNGHLHMPPLEGCGSIVKMSRLRVCQAEAFSGVYQKEKTSDSTAIWLREVRGLLLLGK